VAIRIFYVNEDYDMEQWYYLVGYMVPSCGAYLVFIGMNWLPKIVSENVWHELYETLLGAGKVLKHDY